VDLDPSIPAALAGTAQATRAHTHDEAPDDLRHRLTIQIVSEVVRGGALSEETLLSADVFADDLGGLPIGILNIEQDGLKAIGGAISAGPEGGTTYVPCVVLGDDAIVGPGVLRFGGAGGVGGAFDDLGAGEPDSSEGEPTAEWAVITITSPGVDPVVVRRPIFDRLGPAVRSSGAFDPTSLDQAVLVQLDPTAPPDFLPAQTTHWLTVHTGVVGGEKLRASLRPSEDLAILPGLVHGYHVVREAASMALVPTMGVRTFLDRPNIVSLTVEQAVAEDGTLMARPTLDIWHRGAGALAVADVAAIHPPAMVTGILAHVAERLLVGDAFAEEDSAAATSLSVGAVFDAVRREGIPVRAAASLDDLAGLSFPPDTMARLAEQVTAGLVAIVPERTTRLGDEERVGWWLVDPVTGLVADQLDDGRGASITGYIASFWRNLRNSAILRRLGTCTAIAALGVFLLLLGEGLFAYGINNDSPAAAVLGGLSMAGAAGAGTAFMGNPNLGPKGMCF
jgi:hypothetical protein